MLILDSCGYCKQLPQTRWLTNKHTHLSSPVLEAESLKSRCQLDGTTPGLQGRICSLRPQLLVASVAFLGLWPPHCCLRHHLCVSLLRGHSPLLLGPTDLPGECPRPKTPHFSTSAKTLYKNTHFHGTGDSDVDSPPGGHYSVLVV